MYAGQACTIACILFRCEKLYVFKYRLNVRLFDVGKFKSKKKTIYVLKPWQMLSAVNYLFNLLFEQQRYSTPTHWKTNSQLKIDALLALCQYGLINVFAWGRFRVDNPDSSQIRWCDVRRTPLWEVRRDKEPLTPCSIKSFHIMMGLNVSLKYI